MLRADLFPTTKELFPDRLDPHRPQASSPRTPVDVFQTIAENTAPGEAAIAPPSQELATSPLSPLDQDWAQLMSLIANLEPSKDVSAMHQQVQIATIANANALLEGYKMMGADI